MLRERYQESDWDVNFTEKYVICNACALARNGLIYFSSKHLDLFTNIASLSKIRTQVMSYYYNPNIDYEYEVTPSANPFLLRPSKERALVECIKFLDYVDEGLLIEGLKSYLDNFWDDKIYEVGEHFGVSRETLDYWFEEARNDYDI